MESSGITSPGGEPALDDAGWRSRAAAAKRRLVLLLPVLRVAGFVAAIGIVVVMGVRAASDVHPSRLTWWPLPFALLAAVVWWLLLARGWAVLVTGRFTREDVSLWCRTQALRYLPGGLWAPASRLTVLRSGLLDRFSTVAAENVIALCAALAIGGAALAASGAPYWLPLVLALAVPALGSRALASRTRLDPARTRRATLNYLAAFGCYVVMAILVQGAVSGFHHVLQVAGAGAVAWAGGLVVVIAPGGVGVRELAYVGLLADALPSGELAAGAVTMRIVTIMAELGVLIPAGRPAAGAAPFRAAAVSVLAFVRRHAVFLSLTAAGAAVRVVSSLAYRPALLYPDSVDYLHRASHLQPAKLRPLGYSAFIRFVEHFAGKSLVVIPAVQHVMALAVAVLLYALLVRLGVRRWLAALATAPILLDAYQLVLEEYVLSEALFEMLVVAAIVALLWRRRPGILDAGLAGLLLAGVALTRANGVILIAPALLTVLFLRVERKRSSHARAGPLARRAVRAPLAWGRSLRPALLPAAALLAAFAIPLGGYAAWFHSVYGQYAITNQGGIFLYARVAPFAECRKFTVPADELVLCPRQPVGQRPTLHGSTVSWYMWARFAHAVSPVNQLPSAADRRVLPGRFAKRVILHQPGAFFRAVSHDFLRGFALRRTRHHGELPIGRWQFRSAYPLFPTESPAIIRAHGDGRARVDLGLAHFLERYQRYASTPGPLLALGLIAGLLAALGLGRARRSRLRTASFLFAAAGFVTFGSSVVANEFSWRYQVPMIVLLPPAAALGLTALLERRRARVEAPSDEPAPPPEAARGERDGTPEPAVPQGVSG